MEALGSFHNGVSREIENPRCRTAFHRREVCFFLLVKRSARFDENGGRSRDRPPPEEDSRWRFYSSSFFCVYFGKKTSNGFGFCESKADWKRRNVNTVSSGCTEAALSAELCRPFRVVVRDGWARRMRRWMRRGRAENPEKKEKPRRPGDVMVRVRRFGPRSIFVCRPPVRSLVGRRPVRRPQSDDKSDWVTRRQFLLAVLFSSSFLFFSRFYSPPGFEAIELGWVPVELSGFPSW